VCPRSSVSAVAQEDNEERGREVVGKKKKKNSHFYLNQEKHLFGNVRKVYVRKI